MSKKQSSKNIIIMSDKELVLVTNKDQSYNHE